MLRFSAFLLPAALLLLPTAALAQTPHPAPEKTVMFTIINGDLLTMVVRLERQNHIQCVLQKGVDAHSKINIGLSSAPLFLALQFLASAAGAQVTQSPDGVYVFTPKPIVTSTISDYSMPPPHFQGGFGSGGFGSGGNFPLYPPVVFPHTPPVPLPDILRGQNSKTAQPGDVYRVFAAGKSF